jgi:hypothetical protein
MPQAAQNRTDAETRQRSRRILSLWFPRLAAERILRLEPGLAETPLAVIAEVGNQRQVAALNEAAQARGLYRGQPLSEAVALCPDLVTRIADRVRRGRVSHRAPPLGGQVQPLGGRGAARRPDDRPHRLRAPLRRGRGPVSSGGNRLRRSRPDRPRGHRRHRRRGLGAGPLQRQHRPGPRSQRRCHRPGGARHTFPCGQTALDQGRRRPRRSRPPVALPGTAL